MFFFGLLITYFMLILITNVFMHLGQVGSGQVSQPVYVVRWHTLTILILVYPESRFRPNMVDKEDKHQ